MSIKMVFPGSTARDLAVYRATYRATVGLDDCHSMRMGNFGAQDGVADESFRVKVGEQRSGERRRPAGMLLASAP